MSIGLLLAGCFFTLANQAIDGVETSAIAVAVLLILLQYKINPALLVLAGAAIGLNGTAAGQTNETVGGASF